MTVKLVRDKIPDIMREQGRAFEVEELYGVELDAMLRAKLVEESREAFFATLRTELLEELADLSEVIDAMLKHHGLTNGDLESAMRAKREARGAFDMGYVVDFDG
jgi:predicted house-cleaning noncanonical NTP pyrophosphatase (MazG superfamily)